MKLADRYTLSETGAGALLLDLSSGNVLELNRTSRFIWQLALDGQTETATSRPRWRTLAAP